MRCELVREVVGMQEDKVDWEEILLVLLEWQHLVGISAVFF